jgi:sulfatase maturation enzyme AslB (radical SAM superfamily)
MADPLLKTFCALPWIHSFVNLGGEYQVCCTSEEFHRGILDDSGSIFNVQNSPSLESVMNSNYMKDVRKKLLAGEFPELCRRCVITETNGGVSRRMNENTKMSERMDLSALAAQTAPDGSIPIDIRTGDYRLGNVCNLKCRMCHPASSSQWLQDWNAVKFDDEKLTPDLEQKYAHYDWVDGEAVANDLRAKVAHLEFLHFAGGEPLFGPRMADFLEICIASGRADKIILSYNTNITLVPERVKKLWPRFQEVRLYCSIDGVGAVNDYIRVPSRWAMIDQNIRRLDTEAKDLRISEILLSTTVQAYNMLNLDALFDYVAQFENVAKAINLISLFRPEYLQATILPKAVKMEARQRLLAARARVISQVVAEHRYLLSSVDQVLNFMDSEDRSDLLPQFLEYNRRLDQKNGKSFEKSIPELYQALQSEKNVATDLRELKPPSKISEKRP